MAFTDVSRTARPDVSVVAAQHPSLDGQFDDFLAELRNESRFFGPSARANPKPFPSLIDGLARTDGFRLAAVGYDRIVGACRVGLDGRVQLAVVRGWRGRGIGTELLSASARRAGELGWSRLVIRASHRSDAMRQVAAHVGAATVDAGRGTVEMLLDVRSTSVPA